MNIVLIGFKSCGKTTIGKLIARDTGREFCDLDDLIERLHAEQACEKLPFREIYAKYGNDYFARLESAALKIAVSAGNSVISLGGGTPVRIAKPDAGIAQELGGAKVVYVSVEKETLYKRIMDGGMPAFFEKSDPRGSFDRLYAEREPVYRKLAGKIVDNSGGDPAQAAKAVLDYISENIGG